MYLNTSSRERIEVPSSTSPLEDVKSSGHVPPIRPERTTAKNMRLMN